MKPFLLIIMIFSFATGLFAQQKKTIDFIGGARSYMSNSAINVQDSLPARNWKITDSKRSICGYECRKAIYQKNDSTRIYAWYTTALVPSVGPEGFCGLPGTILDI